jgi:fructose 1,6-bisphosphate aldolase/phosphatase
MFKFCHFVAGNTRGSHHMPLMPVVRNTPSTTNYCIPVVSISLFSMKDGKLGQSVDAFETSDWDYFRRLAVEKSEMMRAQGFIHPATLMPEELEYNKGYKSVMSRLEAKFEKQGKAYAEIN